MTSQEREDLVLAYYDRESRGVVETKALAGLPLKGFQTARMRLARRGLLVRRPNGRWAPA